MWYEGRGRRTARLHRHQFALRKAMKKIKENNLPASSG